MPLELQQVLNDFSDVFKHPQILPSTRLHDHHIPLLPGAALVNFSPYRYSPLHKDENKKQVKELL